MVGSVLLLGLAVWLVVRHRAVSPLAVGCGAGALFLFILVGYGRVSLGVDQAAASRYLYLGAALLSIPAALALTAASRRRPPIEALLVAALALSTLHGAYVLRVDVRGQLGLRLQDRAVVMAAARVVTSGETLLGTRPDPFYGPDIDIADLRTLVRSGALSLPETVDPASLLAVEARIEMSAGSAPALTGPPPLMTVLGGTSADSGSCIVQPAVNGLSARTRLVFSQPSAFSMSAQRAEVVTAVLMSGRTGQAAAAPISYQLQPGAVTWISVSAPHAVLIVDEPGATLFAGTTGC